MGKIYDSEFPLLNVYSKNFSTKEYYRINMPIFFEKIEREETKEEIGDLERKVKVFIDDLYEELIKLEKEEIEEMEYWESKNAEEDVEMEM